jgi:hypothetical protein
MGARSAGRGPDGPGRPTWSSHNRQRAVMLDLDANGGDPTSAR